MIEQEEEKKTVDQNANNSSKNSVDKTVDILKLAQTVGLSIAGFLGATVFLELELAFVNSLLPPFFDNPVIRMMQHILLYWDQSYLKTTMIDAFCKSIPEKYGILDVTSNSPEMLFGTINERDRIVYPAFTQAHIAKITELSTFANGRNLADIVNPSNKIMEGELVTRQLLKFGRRDLPPSEIERAAGIGVQYSPDRAELSYRVHPTFFAASRPLDNRTYTYLRGSGHLFRYHILQHSITDEETKKYFIQVYRPDTNLQEQLRQLNNELSSVHIKEIKLPDENITKEILESLVNNIEEEILEKKLKLSSVIDLRTRGDITRELVAHAVLRTVNESGFTDIEKVEYDVKDVQFVKRNIRHFVEAKINPLFTEEWSRPIVSKQLPKQRAKDLITSILFDGTEKGRNEIVLAVLAKMDVSIATIDNALKELLTDGKINSDRHGFYKMTKEGDIIA